MSVEEETAAISPQATADDLVGRYSRGERHFESTNLNGANLNGANLNGANLNGANLNGANLNGAKLNGAKLNNAELSNAKLIGANLGGADLSKASLICADLSNANLSEANLNGAHLDDANLHGANLADAKLNSAILNNADLSDANLSDAKLSDAKLNNVNLSDAALLRTDFAEADLSGVNARGATLHVANLSGANLSGANFSGVDFQDSFCHNMNIRQADLSRAGFVDVDLRSVTVDGRTDLTDAEVMHCRINRHTLESLGSNYGGMSRGARMTMTIEDGVAKLQASYGGFWSWIHVAALIAFLFPYAAFCIRGYFLGAFQCPQEPCQELGAALWHFIWSGGTFKQEVAFVPFSIFWFSLAYNFLRALLLGKTKALELQQEASGGLPALFSLEGSIWGILLTAAKWGFVLNLVLAIVHTMHFLQVQVPMGALR